MAEKKHRLGKDHGREET
jgi:hypothetical protein